MKKGNAEGSLEKPEEEMIEKKMFGRKRERKC